MNFLTLFPFDKSKHAFSKLTEIDAGLNPPVASELHNSMAMRGHKNKNNFMSETHRWHLKTTFFPTFFGVLTFYFWNRKFENSSNVHTVCSALHWYLIFNSAHSLSFTLIHCSVDICRWYYHYFVYQYQRGHSSTTFN